jgi:hypothetical protein
MKSEPREVLVDALKSRCRQNANFSRFRGSVSV